MRNGEDAIEHLNIASNNNTLPFLIILDMYLPGANGFDVLAHMNKKGISKVPVVILSRIVTKEIEIATKFLGAWQSISKPISRKELDTCMSILDDTIYLFSNK